MGTVVRVYICSEWVVRANMGLYISIQARSALQSGAEVPFLVI